jgi:hypothetical protein
MASSKIRNTLMNGLANIFRKKPSDHDRRAALVASAMQRFNHPANLPLFEFFSGYKSADSGVSGVHPELAEIFETIAQNNNLPTELVMSAQVIVAPNSMVIAWAVGTTFIQVKLQKQHHAAAGLDGGLLDTSYGPDWIQFSAWSRGRAFTEKLRQWVQISYEDALG